MAFAVSFSHKFAFRAFILRAFAGSSPLGIALFCGLSTACAGPASDARDGARRATVSSPPAATDEAETEASPARPGQGCDDWPFSESDRAALATRAFAFLEPLYAATRAKTKGAWTPDRATHAYPEGLVLVALIHDDDEWLSRETVTGSELAAWLNGARGEWPFHGIQARSLRSDDRRATVGARWEGRDPYAPDGHLCVVGTEGTEGMFPDRSWVHVAPIQEEIDLGHEDGIVVVFAGAPDSGLRVDGVVTPNRGI